MNDEKRVYGANNVAHCFSRSMTFPEWLNGLSDRQRLNFKFDGQDIEDFLLGKDMKSDKDSHIYMHIPLPVHFVIKHRNQGKIDSHKWFFKGFCELMQPTYCQTIDVGSIPLHKSISSIVKYLDCYTDVGAATGKIEVMTSQMIMTDNEDLTFTESFIQKAQFAEYKTCAYFEKSSESLFGYISVLPGAFSTFRWE